MAKVVVIKFKKGCRAYYFSDGGLTLAKGQGVVVETARGQEYAIVVDPAREVPDEAVVSPLKPVVRIATEQDTEMVERNDARRGEAMRICKEKIAARELPMKLIDCEFTFDGSKVIFYFSSEGRVDFRDLVKDLAAVFHIRIELRQVGVRDEARMLGGIAPCGREVCCAGSMSEFQKVSIKMAKNQGLSLNPGKISGLCGRLMCCLSYENEYYADAYKKMPKLGGTVGTPEGTGTVVSVNMLKMEVRVKIEQNGALVYRDFPVSEIARRGAKDGEAQAASADAEPLAGAEAADEPEENAPLFAGGAEETAPSAREERPARKKQEGRPQETRGGQNGQNRNRGRGGRGGKGGPRPWKKPRPQNGSSPKKSDPE